MRVLVTGRLWRAVPVVAALVAGANAGAATKEEIREMVAQRPLVEAAKIVQSAVDPKLHSGYAGLVLEASGVALWWKGPVPAAVQAAVDAAKRVAPVRVAPALHSRAELRAAAARIRSRFGRDRIHAIKDPGDGSRLILAVPRQKAGAEADAMTAVPDAGVAAEVVSEDELAPISRDNDAPPWKGGA